MPVSCRPRHLTVFKMTMPSAKRLYVALVRRLFNPPNILVKGEGAFLSISAQNDPRTPEKNTTLYNRLTTLFPACLPLFPRTPTEDALDKNVPIVHFRECLVFPPRCIGFRMAISLNSIIIFFFLEKAHRPKGRWASPGLSIFFEGESCRRSTQAPIR